MAASKKPTAKAPAAKAKEKPATEKKTVSVDKTSNAKYDNSLEAKQEAIRAAARKRAATQGENPTNLPDLAPGAYLVKKRHFINGALYEAGETVQLPEGVEPGKFLKPLGKNPTPAKIAQVRDTEELDVDEETTPASRRGQLEQEMRGGVNLDELENRREVQEDL